LVAVSWQWSGGRGQEKLEKRKCLITTDGKSPVVKRRESQDMGSQSVREMMRRGGLRESVQLLLIVGLVGRTLAQQPTSEQDRVQVEEVAPRPIFPLHSYHNLQVLRWRVPVETLTALWTLWANASSQCGPINVTFWMKAGSFPVLAPGGGHFPPQMLPVLEPQVQVSIIAGKTSGVSRHTLQIDGPTPGHWYMMVAYMPTATAQVRY